MTLRERIVHDLGLARLAAETRRHYLDSIGKFAEFHQRCPSEMGQDEVRAWVAHLNRRGISGSRLNVHFCALKFLYRKTLARPEVVSFLSTPKIPKRLPVVMSREEIERLLGALEQPKYRVLFTTMYAAGLRISEACALELLTGRQVDVCPRCGGRVVPIAIAIAPRGPPNGAAA